MVLLLGKRHHRSCGFRGNSVGFAGRFISLLGQPVAAIGFPDGNPFILGVLFGLGKDHSTVDAYIR